MATPPTLVTDVEPVVGWAGTTTPQVSPSVTVAVGDILIVCCTASGAVTSFGPPTNTGTAFGWAAVDDDYTASNCSVSVWSAVATAAQTCTVSVPMVGGQAWSFNLSQWSGTEGIANSASGRVATAPQIALTTRYANSAVGFFAGDFNAGSGARTWLTVNGSAMMESSYTAVASNYTEYGGYRVDAGAAGAKTVGLSAPTSGKYQFAGFEIRGTGGGGAQVQIRAQGVPLAPTTAVTAISPLVPAGTSAGDLSVLIVSMKPFGTTITTPSGWTKIGEATNGTVAGGVDVGSTKIAMFVKESATPGAIGNITFGGSPNSVGAVIHTYLKDPAGTWDYSSFTSGFDAVAGANYAATGAAGLAVAADDVVVGATSVSGDIGTVTAATIAGMAGATIGAQLRTNAPTTTGNDTRLIVVGAEISAGSSNAAPTFTYTNASSQYGTTMWLRLRCTVAVASDFTGDSTALAVTATGTTAGFAASTGTSTSTAVTASLTAGGVTAFTKASTALTVTATSTAAGRSNLGSTAPVVTATLTAGGATAVAATSAAFAVTATIPTSTGSLAGGVYTGASTATAVTATLTATGVVAGTETSVPLAVTATQTAAGWSAYTGTTIPLAVTITRTTTGVQLGWTPFTAEGFVS